MNANGVHPLGKRGMAATIRSIIERKGPAVTIAEVDEELLRIGQGPCFPRAFSRNYGMVFHDRRLEKEHAKACNGATAGPPAAEVAERPVGPPLTVPAGRDALSAFVRLGVLVEEIGVAEARRLLAVYESLTRTESH